MTSSSATSFARISGRVATRLRWAPPSSTRRSPAIGLTELVGFTRPSNRSSRRVLEKLRFRFERTFVTDGDDYVLYRRLA